MADETQVLIAGKSEQILSRLRQMISSVSGIRSEVMLMTNGNADPLAGVINPPGVLILHTDGTCESLEAIARRGSDERPLLLVIGDNPPADTVKFAVRAGARDFLGENEPENLARSLEELLLELHADSEHGGDITSVINAKGGAGGTFITSNLAHITGMNADGSVLVLDLDFQFASLPHYFDVIPKRSFLDALANAHELDRVAVEAYAVEHSSGVSIMAPIPDEVTVADFDINERIGTLLPILRSRYEHVLVDVPRHVDDVSTPILRASDNVLIVLQQSLPSIRDAVRLKTTLVRELEIDKNRIKVIVNRHIKAGSIELDDIREALGEDTLWHIPNHFKSVAQSIDLGVPIADYAPSSPVVRALTKIQAKLFGTSESASRNLHGTDAIRRLKQWSPF